MSGYKNLKVWKKAVDYAVDVYKATEPFPKSEVYGLTSQMRRASVSVSSNIAEGSERDSIRDFLRFINIARGSLAELETQMLIAVKLDYMPTDSYFKLHHSAAEIGKMLNGMRSSLESKLETDNWILDTKE